MESFGKLHPQLLDLHKALLQYQGRILEVKLEKHLGPYDLWHLSLNDENFVWLRKISEIIVEMDELNDTKEKDPQIFTKIRGDLKNLFFPAVPSTSDFDTRLAEALEKDPHICLQMGQLKGLLG